MLKNRLIDFIIEPARSQLIPSFPEVKEAAFEAGADGMTISGSGPTVFAISNSMNDAINIELAMQKAFNNNNIECKTLITSPCPNGARILDS